MRIGMPTTSYPSSPDDVGGRFVRVLARALVRRGHEIEVVAPEHHDANDDPGDAGIVVHRVPYLRPRGLQRTFGGHGAPDNLRTDPRAWLGVLTYPLALARVIRQRERRWDAILSHWAIPSALAVPARRRRNHVAVLHGSDVHLATALPAVAREAIGRSASSLAFASSELRDRFVRGLRNEVSTLVQPMGVAIAETDGRSRDAARARVGFSGLIALAMARLVPIKGLDRAIDAVARTPGVTLVIAGEGPERARLEARARRACAPVRFLGLTTGEARLDVLAGADLFLAPSRTLARGRGEGAPTAVLEALAAGLPVLAASSGGLAEVVSHEQTGLVSTGASDALAIDLARLRDDPALRARLGANARLAARAYDVDTVAARFECWLGQGSTTTASSGGSSANTDAGMLAG